LRVKKVEKGRVKQVSDEWSTLIIKDRLVFIIQPKLFILSKKISLDCCGV
jgi:hypothetical protein